MDLVIGCDEKFWLVAALVARSIGKHGGGGGDVDDGESTFLFFFLPFRAN